tara:strand:- start:270 stop:686 length:417 start_codon:yes stop_codon:yes gene_type:complete
MPLHTLQFTDPINSSVTVGDHVFYVQGMVNSSQGTLPTNSFEEGYLNNAYYFGQIYSISNPNAINGIPTVNVNVALVPNTQTPLSSAPTVDDYVFYLKDSVVDQGDIKGYYASVKLKNNSNDKVELFALSANIEESSK